MAHHPRILVQISLPELERRWALMRKMMLERSIDVIVLQATNDWLGGGVKWVTDVPANNGYPRTVLFYANELMTIVEMGPFGGRRILDGTDPVHRGVGLILNTPSFPAIDYTVIYDANLAVADIQARGCRRVGLANPGGLLAGFAQGLRQGLANAVFEDVTDDLDGMKAIKSAEEQALIARAATLQDAVFSKVCAAIRPGLRDVDITAIAQMEAQVLGSEQGIFLGASSRIGMRSPFMGRHFQGRALEAGDHLSLLIEVNGPGGCYCEIARTLVLGTASQALLEGFAAVKSAQDHTLSHLKPGRLACEVAALHDDYMLSLNLPPEIRLYAHGQGYDMVERPLIRRDESMTIAEGMNLAVHPGYETDRIFAVICDNYLIGPGGPGECLHKTPKRIFEI